MAWMKFSRKIICYSYIQKYLFEAAETQRRNETDSDKPVKSENLVNHLEPWYEMLLRLLELLPQQSVKSLLENSN